MKKYRSYKKLRKKQIKDKAYWTRQLKISFKKLTGKNFK